MPYQEDENRHNTTKAEILANSLLNNPINIEKLLSKNNTPAINQVREIAHRNLDGTGALEFDILMLDEIAKPDDISTQDKKDTATILLSTIIGQFPWRGSTQEALLEHYFELVENLTDRNDIYGSAYSLLDIADFLNAKWIISRSNENHDKFFNAWGKFLDKIEDVKDKKDFEDKFNDILKKLESLPDIPPIEEVNQKLDDREKPDFNENQQELYDYYLKVTKKNGSIKIDLWNRTPEFRAEVEKYGLSLASFWNITTARQAQEIVEQLKNLSPNIQQKYSEELKNLVGINLDEITEEQTQIVADQIMTAGENLKHNLNLTSESFAIVIANFQDILERAKTERIKNKKKYFGPITSFLKRYANLEVKPELEEIESVFQDLELMGNAEQKFNTENDKKRNDVDKINELFNQRANREFRLMARDEQALYLGDYTGDCTSFHLNVGFNAWTLPGWLSNPGFNFFIINNPDGSFLAKAGMYLSIENESTPTIVVDSFEITSILKEDEITTEEVESQIAKGLSFLKKWAIEQSIGNIRVSTIANSFEFRDIIKDNLTPKGYSELTLLGGTSGIEELRSSISGKVLEEQIYLQNSDGTLDPNEEHDTSVYEPLARAENSLRNTIVKLQKEDADAFIEYCRKGNWSKTFETYMNIMHPEITSLLGTGWEQYHNLVPDEKYENPNSIEYYKFEQTLNEILIEKIKEKEKEEDGIEDGYEIENAATSYTQLLFSEDPFYPPQFNSYGDEQIQSLTNFILTFITLEHKNLTPTDVIKKIFIKLEPKAIQEREISKYKNRNILFLPNLEVIK